MNNDRHEQEVEREIERHVQEIGRLIDLSQPEKQHELRQVIWSLMEQEVLQTAAIEQTEKEWRRKPMNPLALGLLFLVLGVALSFILPPVGLMVAFGGVLGVSWGVLTCLSGRKEQTGQTAEKSQKDNEALSSAEQNAKSHGQATEVEGERRSA